jgi:TatD DNase family protein
MTSASPELVDSHCHLDFPEFAAELDAVVARAREAGVGRLLTICTRLSKFHEVLAVAERFDRMFCSVGVHPHEAAHEPDVALDRIVTLAKHPKVVGIGEAGLDYYYDKSPRDQQKSNFRRHMQAAIETNLPLIVHTRDADDDMAQMLTEGCGEGALRGVLHCFTSSRQLAEKALELGFYISISGIVTFKNAEDLRQTVRGVPLDRLLVETDSPFLAPIPVRGKPCEPAFVAYTAAKVAELKSVDKDALARATTENFFRLFDRAKAPS